MYNHRPFYGSHDWRRFIIDRIIENWCQNILSSLSSVIVNFVLIIIVIINVALSVVGTEVGAGSSVSTVSVGTSVGAMALRWFAMEIICQVFEKNFVKIIFVLGFEKKCYSILEKNFVKIIFALGFEKKSILRPSVVRFRGCVSVSLTLLL